LAAASVPEPERLVLAAGEDPPAVGREGDALGAAGVAFQAEQLPTRAHLPDDDGRLAAGRPPVVYHAAAPGRNRPLAVGRERHGADRLRVPLKSADLRPALGKAHGRLLRGVAVVEEGLGRYHLLVEAALRGPAEADAGQPVHLAILDAQLMGPVGE